MLSSLNNFSSSLSRILHKTRLLSIFEDLSRYMSTSRNRLKQRKWETVEKQNKRIISKIKDKTRIKRRTTCSVYVDVCSMLGL